MDAFMFDLFFGETYETLNIWDVEQALDHFRKSFNAVVNMYAPFEHSEHRNRSDFFPPLIKADEATIPDSKEICEAFNKHFVKTGTLFERTHREQPLPTNELDSRERLNNYFVLKEFTCKEVYKELQDMNLKCALGVDGLDPLFLRFASPLAATYITHIFNLSVSTGTIPEVWKAAYVTPKHKGGEKSDLNNYRPISKFS